MDLLNEFIHQYTVASLTKRWVGAAIDFAIYLGPIFLILAPFYGEATIDQEGAKTYTVSGTPAFLGAIAAWFIRCMHEAFNKGKSLGKAIMGVRVVRATGENAGLDQIMARHLFDIIDFLPTAGIIGLIVAANSPHKQRVGDRVAQTIVISTRKTQLLNVPKIL